MGSDYLFSFPVAFRQTRRASTDCACPPIWIVRFRLRLDENAAYVGFLLAHDKGDGRAVMGEPVLVAACSLFQKIGGLEGDMLPIE